MSESRFINAKKAVDSTFLKGVRILNTLQDEEKELFNLKRFPSLQQSLDKSQRKVVAMVSGDIITPSLASCYVTIQEAEMNVLVKKLKLTPNVITNISKHFSAFAFRHLLGQEVSIAVNDILRIGRLTLSSLMIILNWSSNDPQRLVLATRLLELYSKATAPNGELVLDFSGFISIISVLSDSGSLVEKARLSFAIFDIDNDHLLDCDELRESLLVCLKANQIKLDDIQMAELVYNTLKSYGVPRTAGCEQLAAALDENFGKLNYPITYLMSLASNNRHLSIKAFSEKPQDKQQEFLLERENRKNGVKVTFQNLLPDHKRSNVWSYCINISQYCVMITSFPRLMACFSLETHEVFENSPVSSSTFDHEAFVNTIIVVAADGKVSIKTTDKRVDSFQIFNDSIRMMEINDKSKIQPPIIGKDKVDFPLVNIIHDAPTSSASPLRKAMFANGGDNNIS